MHIPMVIQELHPPETRLAFLLAADLRLSLSPAEAGEAATETFAAPTDFSLRKLG